MSLHWLRSGKKAIKEISLGTSLISLVLTQSAILAFAYDVQNPSVNGLLGSILGAVTALLDGYLIWRIVKIEAQENICLERKEKER